MVLPRSCKVVLVCPNDSIVYSGYKRSVTKRTPLALAYVAGALLTAGHEVSIVDASLDELSNDDVVRSIENVLAELEEIYHRFEIHNLVFYDDSFTTRKDRVIGICKEMIRRGLRFRYQVQLRLDQVGDEVMHWLVESGCEQASPGIESGNPEIFAASISPAGSRRTSFSRSVRSSRSTRSSCGVRTSWAGSTRRRSRCGIQFA